MHNPDRKSKYDETGTAHRVFDVNDPQFVVDGEDPIDVEFIQWVPVSVICRVRVAKQVNGRVVDEVVSGEVALYHPYDQLPGLVNRVLEQLEGQG